MKKAIIITEEERKSIMSMYGLLMEADPDPTANEYTVDVGSLFQSGRWKETSMNTAKILQELNKAKTWIKTKQEELKKSAALTTGSGGKVLMVKIIAGESLVTNYDGETPNPASNPLQPLQLSNNRAVSIQNYINKILDGWVREKLILTKPIFESPELVIGTTAYDKFKDDPNNSKYTKEQFVKVKLIVQPPDKCLADLTIEVMYYKAENGAFPCRGGHQCDDALFDVKLNNTFIGVANLNNANDGGDRYNKMVVTATQAKEILGGKPGDITMYFECKNKNKRCHSSTPEIRLSRSGATLYHKCAPSIQETNDYSKKKIMVLDCCGNLKLEGEKAKAAMKDVSKMALPKGMKTGYTVYDIATKKVVEMTEDPSENNMFGKAPLFGVTNYIASNVTSNIPAEYYSGAECKSADKANYGNFCLWKGYKSQYNGDNKCSGITSIAYYQYNFTTGNGVAKNVNSENERFQFCKPKTPPKNPLPVIATTNTKGNSLPKPYNTCYGYWKGDVNECNGLTFMPSGYNAVYTFFEEDKDNSITFDGEFKNGKLYTGTWYEYDSDGILLHIHEFKEGVYTGEGTL